VQLLQGEGPQRLEHRVALSARPVVGSADQRGVDQAAQSPYDVGLADVGVDADADLDHGVEREAPVEDREPFEQLALRLVEQPMAA